MRTAVTLGILLLGAAYAEELQQLDGSTLADATLVQDQFEKIERLADEVLDTEGEVQKDVAVSLLRAAFKLCPTCPHPRWGKNTKEVFYLDGLGDRTMLTKDIFPALFGLKVTDVLWIGVQPYTLRYEYMMAQKGVKMTSLEVTPAEAVYGSTYRHIIDKAQNIRNHVEEGAFDAVILNGVIGWGLDSAEDINATFAALHKVMRGRAPLVVGFNKNPLRAPYWDNGLLPLFNDSTLGALPHSVDIGDGADHHAFEFFERVPGVGGGHHGRTTMGHKGATIRRERWRAASKHPAGGSGLSEVAANLATDVN